MVDSASHAPETEIASERRDESEDSKGGVTTERADPWQRVRATLLGLIGGTFATLVMTLFRMPISSSLPPTANFLARFVGGEPDDYTLSAFALHIGYGAAAGGLYGFLFEGAGSRTRAGIELHDSVRALVYSFGLSVFGSRVILAGLLRMDLDRDEALIFHVGHVVYGLALGAWIGSNR